MRPRGSLGKRDARGWLDPRQHHRSVNGDAVCSCKAYPHPHRMFGGRCTLKRWVKGFFDPLRRECVDCHSRTPTFECEVVLGVERPWQCPELREFARVEAIVLYGRAREQRERSRE